MNRKLTILFVLVMALFCACVQQADARALTGGRGIPIVSDPKDLNLVNLKNLSDFLYSDLKEKGTFGPIRRFALDVKAKQMGIPNPRKAQFHAGWVVDKGHSGNSTAILVICGDLTFKDIKSTIDKDYNEYMSRNNGTPAISEDEVKGMKITKYGYSERPYEVCLLQIPEKKSIILGAIPKGDYSVLEPTIEVVKGDEKLNEKVPDNVEVETTFSLTKREIERIVKFNKPRGELRKKVADGMKSLAQKLGIPHSDDETVPLEERIRGQLALSDAVTVKYKWDTDSKKAAAYDMAYTIKTKSPEAAETLKGLLTEQITRLSEKSPWDKEKESIGRITVNSNDQEVCATFLLDTPEAQYQHMSLVMGQVFQYQTLMTFLDRNGSAKE
ncbi:MAG: hypothetical protein HQM08_18915 [Candidatus Riflebacteria bacterium]|nr:hypothetical protein [Candidatus Riflebacteria bacterium]